MKVLAKKALLALPGFPWLCRQLTRRHVRVLMYHRFGTADHPRPDRPDAQTLAWQMAQVKAHHAVWSVAQHHEAVASGRPIRERCPVVVTIDDGYRDVRDVAQPVFRAHGIPVVLYVTTGFVDGRLWLWWDQLTYLFEQAAATSFWLEHAGEHHQIDLTTPARRMATWHQVGIRCCFLPDDLKLGLITSLAMRLGVVIPDAPPPDYAPLTWDELRAMQREGVDLGAHTVTHAILTRVSLTAARRELAESKRRLEEELGRPVPWFCFPQGGPADHSPEVVAEVAAAGFASAYLAFPNAGPSSSIYTMPRWSASSERTEFLWILCGGAYLSLALRRLLRRDTGPGRAYWAGAKVDAHPMQVTTST